MGIIKNKTNNNDKKKVREQNNFENRYLYNDARDEATLHAWNKEWQRIKDLEILKIIDKLKAII